MIMLSLILEALASIGIGFIGFLLFAHNPIIPTLRILTLPIPDKFNCIVCFWGAWFRSLLTFIPDILSPVIVPIALLFTKWEDDKLPWIFSWWDNDASINGDVRTDDSSDGKDGWGLRHVQVEDTPEARAMCYWAKNAHPRSFKARYVWLGLRNRASYLSMLLGKDHPLVDVKVWESGNVASPDYTGWRVHRIGNIWRYFETVKVGPIFFRFHYGYKIPKIPHSKVAMVTAIAFSFQKAD
jgi:hypothetical protein